MKFYESTNLEKFPLFPSKNVIFLLKEIAYKDILPKVLVKVEILPKVVVKVEIFQKVVEKV